MIKDFSNHQKSLMLTLNTQIAICTTIPTSGLGAFANIIITSLNFTVLQTQLLAMVLGAYIIIVLLSSAWFVKKTGQNTIVMGVYMIP